MQHQRSFTEVWTIIPKQQNECIFKMCPRCDQKSEFISSRKFRVNANGKVIDVWLIYNCKVCNKSWNYPILERVHVSTIDKNLLQSYMSNDEELARSIGLKQMRCFESFEILKQITKPDADERLIKIDVPFAIKVRADKVLSLGLGISRNQLLKVVASGEIRLVNNSKCTRFLKKPIRMGQFFKVF